MEAHFLGEVLLELAAAHQVMDSFPKSHVPLQARYASMTRAMPANKNSKLRFS